MTRESKPMPWQRKCKKQLSKGNVKNNYITWTGRSLKKASGRPAQGRAIIGLLTEELGRTILSGV